MTTTVNGTKSKVVAKPPKDGVPHDHKEPLGDFEYTCEDGTKIVLPAFNSVKPGIVRKTRKLEPVDQFFTTLEMIAAEEVIEIIDDLSPEEFGELQKEWFAHSGIDLGE